MKWLIIISAFAIAGCSGFANEKQSKKDSNSNLVMRSSGSVAVLELFTSEGCSSCPPADRLLPQLASLDSNIIPLSFHVDYWNRLGWTDPFSKAEFTKRQGAYAEHFHLESIYTPQLVVNGQYELVGSNRSTAEAEIKKALGEKVSTHIIIDGIRKHNKTLFISCHAEGDLAPTNIIAVIVQKHAEMNIRAGENRGKKLSHLNVVRSFIQRPAQQSMNIEIKVPADLTDENSQVILYTQRRNDLKITGAAIYGR